MTMAGDHPKKENRFDWVELSKTVALPLVTLFVGILFNNSLNTRQERDNNVRLYADMMGRREEADSALRKDMFKSILDTFLIKDTNQARRQSLEREVLNIELLAYNFHESLDLGPLFKHVQRDLTENKENTDPSLLWRLERVAEDVKEQQLAVLSDSGAVEHGDIDLATIAGTFGKSTVDPQHGEIRGGPTLCMSINSSDGVRHHRQFKIRFLDFRKDRREVELSLSVSKPLPVKVCNMILDPKVEQENTEAAAQFWVGLFGFPMIDNTHLTESERCAVSVTGITEDTMQVAVSYFQASRASLKDKPYYDEVLHDLLHNPATSQPKEQ